MEYEEKLLQAIQQEEIIPFLRGDNGYKIEMSQFVPAVVPTDTGKILSRAIYKLYERRPIVKQEFETALITMLDGTLFDIYVAVLYVMGQLFKEKNNISPFKLDFNTIIPKLQQKLRQSKDGFQGEVESPDSFAWSGLWNEIERFDKICNEEYKISLLS